MLIPEPQAQNYLGADDATWQHWRESFRFSPRAVVGKVKMFEEDDILRACQRYVFRLPLETICKMRLDESNILAVAKQYNLPLLVVHIIKNSPEFEAVSATYAHNNQAKRKESRRAACSSRGESSREGT